MSPRARKVSDDDVFAAAYRVMNRVGPGDMTLGLIAEEAGVTAGLLVQRFGSKRALMVRLAELAAASSGGMIEALRAESASPLAALDAYVQCMAGLASSPEALVRSLAYLTDDLSDPELRVHLETQGKQTRSGLAALIREAIDVGELVESTDVKALVRVIEAVIPGSMLTWATYRTGTAAKWMRRDLEAVLAPFRGGRR
jgi:AcrR family transcriptional regulator